MTEKPVDSAAEGRRATVWRYLAPALMLTLLALAAAVLRHELRNFRLRDVLAAAHAIDGGRLRLSLLFTVAAYCCLIGYDVMALRYAGRKLKLRQAGLGSFIAYGLSQTLGFPLLTGSSVRVRLWSGWGLSAEEIAQAIAFVGVIFIVGVLSVGGTVLILEPPGIIQLLHLPLALVRPLGFLSLAAAATYLGWSIVRGGTPIRIRDWKFPTPRPPLAVAHIIVSVGEWSAAAAVLFVLLPVNTGFSYGAFLGVFMLSQFAGVASNVPGGIGVFESLMVVLLGDRLPASVILGTLLVYRGIYYLVPFVFAVLLLAAREIVTNAPALRAATGAVGSFANRWLPPLVPFLLGATTFVAGLMLLVSGTTPAVHSRLRFLDRVLPLGVIELSHFAASLAGAGLVILARGLSRRIDIAWGLTASLLVVGIAGSLLRGLDWEEAVALSLVLAALLPARRAFYRKASLTAETWSPGWIAAVVVVGGAVIWLGLFTYQRIEYRNDLWWQFVLRGDASRFLRGTAGALTLFAAAGLLRLFRHPTVRPPVPAIEDFDRVKEVLAHSPDVAGNLALLGDKSLLFSQSGKAFLMYGVNGRSWVALGDPIGPREEQVELVWRFREEADRHGGWTVFYQVGQGHLPLYIDLGLTLLKVGEEARVPLAEFSLEGGHRRGLRRNHRQLEEEGVTVEVVPPSQVGAILPELERISDDWLSEKATREKGFSLGRFDPDYLQHFPVALVKHHDRAVAFANLWAAGDRSELSIDLMRYSREAPPGVMQFLFTEMMLRGRTDGYRWFILGMAPMSGLENRPLAPLWNRVGALLFSHGEHFYNFQGLREYKEKFRPVWEPRYLASPGGLALPRILTNVAALVSGGLKGVVTR